MKDKKNGECGGIKIEKRGSGKKEIEMMIE